MPQENYIYYSDSKNNPYGDKNDKEVIGLCDNITKKLIEQNCKVIVIACNTATAKALQYLREKYINNTFVGIEPAYKIVHDFAYNKPTLIMATKGTIESEKFKLLFRKYDNKKTYLLPCIGLADIIEENNKEKIKEYLEEHLGKYKNKVDNVVLGCTHYPLIKEEIRNVLGNVKFFDGAPGLAKHLKNILEKKELLNFGEGKVDFQDSNKSKKKEERFFEILYNDDIELEI